MRKLKVDGNNEIRANVYRRILAETLSTARSFYDPANIYIFGETIDLKSLTQEIELRAEVLGLDKRQQKFASTWALNHVIDHVSLEDLVEGAEGCTRPG